MKDKAIENDASDSVRQNSRRTVEKLIADAERLKQIFELQSLKANPIEVSVDTKELLEINRAQQAESADFGTLHELLILLNLMASKSD